MTSKPIIPLIMSTPETEVAPGKELTARRIGDNDFRIALRRKEGLATTTCGHIDLSLQQLRILLVFAVMELVIMEEDEKRKK